MVPKTADINIDCIGRTSRATNLHQTTKTTVYGLEKLYIYLLYYLQYLPLFTFAKNLYGDMQLNLK